MEDIFFAERVDALWYYLAVEIVDFGSLNRFIYSIK